MKVFRSVLAAIFVTLTAAWVLPAQSATSVPSELSSYQLGPDDLVTVRVLDAEEIPDKPFRIDEQGNMALPMVGVVHAAGLTTRELRAELETRFRKYIREPQVSVFVSEMRSQPVSVVGAVNSPGVQQLQGHKTLVEVLSQAGGLKPDAGFSVKITRQMAWGMIPLPGAKTDAEGRFSVAEVPLKGLLEAIDPAQNIAIMPNDVLTVPQAEVVYVVGDVRKAGGFALAEKRNISVLQALALAEGLTPTAKATGARILRQKPGNSEREDITVDLKKLLAGQGSDVALQANDILFVPTSGAKNLGVKAIESMFSIGTSMAIIRPF